MAKDRIDLLQIWMLSEPSTEIQSQLVKVSDQKNQFSQLRSHIDKPFTTREGVKQMRDVEKMCKTIPCVWSNSSFKTFAWLLSKEESFVWLKDDLCDHFKHDMMTTWGRIDSNEKPKQQYIYVFLEKVTFFSKLLSFTVVKSLVTNGSQLITRCFRFIFHSWLC